MAKNRETLSEKRERAREIYNRLIEKYPDAGCSLSHRNPLQLLIATILSAQCTDARVNIVTRELFKKYRTAQDYASAPPEELEKAIHSCGFYRSKTRNIQRACRTLVERFNGEVPNNMDDLLSLSGVGRKTANVVLGDCFGINGVVVDTHCGRIARRLGFTRETDPIKVEQDLMKIWDKQTWSRYSHCMVFHGREICTARAPRCTECPLLDLCPYPKQAQKRKR